MLTETAYQTHTFKNGIKLIFQFNDSFVGHSAILVNAGTRDENTDKEGLAHFIEHVLFKGTKKRKSIHILNRLEVVGGELNAYTTKEETCIHASYLTPYFERAMELMIDIVFNAVFPPKEIIKEQEVVIDEIRTYLDTPAEQIFDDFESQVFAKHPLGSHVLGTIESVSAFTQKDISHFTKQNYTTDKMVISVVGNYQFETVVATIEKHLHTIKATTTTVKRNAFTKYKPTQVIVKKATEQAHFILGGKAYSFKDKQRIELVLLNNILGGPGMNSRLNLSIREKYGYTYNIESNYNAYSDTGIFSLYLATDKKLLDKTIKLAHIELDKLCQQAISKQQLKQYKQQLLGQIALAQENKASVMIGLGRSMLNHGKVDTLKQLQEKIEAITSAQLLNVAHEIFDTKKHCSLLFIN